MYVRTYVHTYVRTYVRTHARTHVRTYVRTHVRGALNLMQFAYGGVNAVATSFVGPAWSPAKRRSLRTYVHELISIQKGVVLPLKNGAVRTLNSRLPFKISPVWPRLPVKTRFRSFPTFYFRFLKTFFQIFLIFSVLEIRWTSFLSGF